MHSKFWDFGAVPTFRPRRFYLRFYLASSSLGPPLAGRSERRILIVYLGRIFGYRIDFKQADFILTTASTDELVACGAAAAVALRQE